VNREKGTIMKRPTVICLLVALCVAASTQALPIRPSIDNDPARITGGFVNYNTGSASGEVAFAVFESEDYNPGFTPGAGWGKYVYAYEIYNSDRTNASISSFVVNVLAATSPVKITSDGAMLKGKGGDAVSTMGQFFVLDGLFKKASWQFGSAPENESLDPGKHSVVLLFSSDYEPGRTTARIGSENSFDTISVIAPHVPEPATMALLGLGAVSFLRRRNA